MSVTNMLQSGVADESTPTWRHHGTIFLACYYTKAHFMIEQRCISIDWTEPDTDRK